MKPNLDKLENLSNDQLKKISNDVETIGIRKAAQQASKGTDRSIDKTCVQRLKERSIVNRFLAESPDASQAATEILRFAVTGRPDFSEATIKVLEETAFKLSLQCVDSEEEVDADSETPGPETPPKDSAKPGLSISEFALKALNQITVMLARYRNASVRERMAKVQEGKLQLNREQFEWKKSLQASRAANKSTISAPAASSPNSEIKQNDLDRLARTLDNVERRTCETFNLPYDGSTKPESSAESSPVALSPTSSTHLSDTKVSDKAHNAQPSELGRPYLQTEKNASPANPQPDRKAHDGSGAGQHSEIRSARESTSVVKDSPSVENSAIRNPQSAIPDPYLQSEKNSEPPSALNSAVAASSPAAVSLQGAQHSETHAPTASSPQSAMPEPYLQAEKNASARQDWKAEASAVENSAIRIPHSEIATNSALCTFNSKLKSHAIRRWRGHIPWPKGEPEPDGSWRDECPCGNPAPCSEHPELKGRVRCYKPQHPDYQAGLKEFNVPYYKPTAEEIGCTQASLDRSCDLFADNPRMKDPPDPRFDPFKQWLKAS